MKGAIIVLACLCLVTACLLGLLYSKVSGKIKDADFKADKYTACLETYTAYRKIRHDYANYVQIIPVMTGEENRDSLLEQKKHVYELAVNWLKRVEK